MDSLSSVSSVSSAASGASVSSHGVKFVDPLLLRKQEKKEKGKTVAMETPKGKGKVPVGQLVALFDTEKS